MHWARAVNHRAMKGFDVLLTALFYAAMAMLVFLLLTVGAGVLFRRGFNAPLPWTVQAAQYTLFYIGFLSAPYILRANGHARITIVLEMLNAKNRALLNLFTSLLGALVCGVLTWVSGDATWDAYVANTIYYSQFAFPKYLAWWVMPFCFGLMCVQFVRMAVYQFYVYQGHAEGTAEDPERTPAPSGPQF
jgi:C4-dicarboxylate transporter DctQ subunit